MFISLCFVYPFFSWVILIEWQELFVYEGLWIPVTVSFSSFIPLFVFLLISFMAFICHREFNFYIVKCCLSWLLSFTAFLGRPLVPPLVLGRIFCWLQRPLCYTAFIHAQQPHLPKLCAFVGRAGWQGGEKKVPACGNRGGSSSCLVIHLFLSFCLCFSLSFSLQISTFCLLPVPPQVLG